MKIGLLTFHRAYNYGAVLQCYALYKSINKLGAECEVIDYFPSYFKKTYQLKNETGIKAFLRRIKYYKVRHVIAERNSGFEEFLINNIALSRKTYAKEDDFKGDLSRFDCVIIGSDQVWNEKCANFDPIFFGRLPEIHNLYSYAASFGFDKIPDALREEYRDRLSPFSKFSVREESGIKIIQDLTGRIAQVHCDPTLLLDRAEWERIANISRLDANEDYILVYYAGQTKSVQEKALAIAEKYKSKLIILTSSMTYQVLSGKNDIGFVTEKDFTCSPEKFVSLFKNAKAVFTNSFHGTCFSIIFHVPFWVQCDLGNGRKNNRAEALLKKLGMSQYNEVDPLSVKFDWKNVEKELSELRNDGCFYLKTIIEQK